ncbi:cellobiose phosphotransferase system IIC component [Liquorilactobacillus ghanensis DSM 18630]|uniref:Permease IIC component n=1 Tax=Liquorilactobacillus ghanensis DSM 18630 TaxID=1423750 RepID=A0A0R1VSS6_9LACO|nr:PTS cellobiose transporter subunit IIC [Liquorilactobacillus ghanensis]KRM05718.1 cellobiose phosphotransferase system IIC component [Liquorilactobacillus ghanensis DSM 18630]
MNSGSNKIFQFLNNQLTEPMTKFSQFRIVRGITAAGTISMPFIITGSIFIFISAIPRSFPFLAGLWSVSLNKVANLYQLINTATMGIVAVYFCLAFGYEYTRIQAQEEKIDLVPLNGALLSLMAFVISVPELVFKSGVMSLLHTSTVIDGWRISNGITRFGATGIFTAIVMAIIAVKIYTYCVKHQWKIRLPKMVPIGVSNSIAFLIPTILIALVVVTINGFLIAVNTDIYRSIAIPFKLVTNLTNTWVFLLIVYFIVHVLWIVGIHGASIVTSLLTPIMLVNLAANQNGAHLPFAGEFNNTFVIVGGSGATLGMVIYITFFARSAQLSNLGKTSLVPALFNINEPILFGTPVVYNSYTAIPFFLAPMASMSIAYFATKLHMVNPPIAQVAWSTPIGLSSFIGSGGDWRTIILAIVCVIVAFVIWLPFIKHYDNKLFYNEQKKIHLTQNINGGNK